MSTSPAPIETGGFANKPPQTTIPRVSKGTYTRKSGVGDPATPFPKVTGGMFSDTATTKLLDCGVTASHKPKSKPQIYLAAGDDTDQNLTYAPPSRGSMTSAHRVKVVMTSATDQPYSTDAERAVQGKNPEGALFLEEQEEGYWFTYGVKHEAWKTQLRDYALKKTLAFLRNNLNKPNPTQKEVIPIYIGWLEKAARLYQQKKDEQASSARNSASTISDFLSSVEDCPTPTASHLIPTDIKWIPTNTENGRHGDSPVH
jgi:hypothetical protein